MSPKNNYFCYNYYIRAIAIAYKKPFSRRNVLLAIHSNEQMVPTYKLLLLISPRPFLRVYIILAWTQFYFKNSISFSNLRNALRRRSRRCCWATKLAITIKSQY